MAESVIKAVSLYCGILLLGSASTVRAADSLLDPTRPSASLHAGTAAVPSGPSEPVLQYVLVSPKRRVAVISGETVQIGDRVGDARVVRIAENEVVLTRDGQSQTLKLFPGIEKRREKGGTSARETGRRQ